MVFSTTLFLFLFLPLFLLLYYALPFRLRSGCILLASYFFYAWWRLDFLTLFAATTFTTYVFGRWIGRTSEPRPARAKLALSLGVITNLGVLAYFKYFNFGVESLNALLTRLGGEPMTTWQVILPIGISFYIFQATSYLIDIYRGDAPADDSFWDVAAYIALFPQLIAGPILRYKDVATQFKARTHSFDKFSEGSLRFMVGFCKKVLIADGVASIANASFALGAPSFVDAWLGALAYAVQLYFDFSGYSDMAIGLGLMMGFRFSENFNQPYLARSVTDFWRRWHISLSGWLRDYLYVPLGGNRLGRRRTYVNLALVMLLGGLWHGAAWTFVIWGAWHGGLLALERLQKERQKERRAGHELPEVLAIPRTFVLVTLGWVTFRAAGLDGALTMYGGMAGLNGFMISDTLAWQLAPSALLTLAIAFVLIAAAPRWNAAERGSRRIRMAVANANLAVIPLFVLSVLRLSAESFSPFLYFQF